MTMNPLAVILVMNGSKGDQLLFRYPYVSETIIIGDNLIISGEKKIHPYSLTEEKDWLINKTNTKSYVKDGRLVGFPDKVMSNLFSVKKDLCGKKFELKVNDVRFVGHPTDLSKVSSTSTIDLFHIVFALRTTLSHKIVSCYHDLSLKLGKAIVHEESRASFFSKEAKIMLKDHDEAAQMADTPHRSPFEMILENSKLAQYLKSTFNSLCTTGIVDVTINNWININFCLPQKVHSNLSIANQISNRTLILDGVKKLKPYHTLLLLEDKNNILNQLKTDMSSALRRLLNVAMPTDSFSILATEADLTLNQVFLLSIHLVYWGKATIIYPLCSSNTYITAPYSNISVHHRLSEEFSTKFPGESLHNTLSEFSLPMSLRDKCDPIKSPQEQLEVQQVLWLLKHDLLQQLHTYVHIVCVRPTSIQTINTGDSVHNMWLRNIYSRNHSQSSSEVSSISGQRCPPNVTIQSDEAVINGTSTSSTNTELPSSFDTTTPTIYDSLSQSRFANYTPSESDIGSVCSDERSPSPGVAGQWNNCSGDKNEILPIQNLKQYELNLIRSVPDAQNPADLALFAKLCVFFRGEHHLEEIMYRTNTSRSQLLEILDKFSEVLVTCKHPEDSLF